MVPLLVGRQIIPPANSALDLTGIHAEEMTLAAVRFATGAGLPAATFRWSDGPAAQRSIVSLTGTSDAHPLLRPNERTARVDM